MLLHLLQTTRWQLHHFQSCLLLQGFPAVPSFIQLRDGVSCGRQNTGCQGSFQRKPGTSCVADGRRLISLRPSCCICSLCSGCTSACWHTKVSQLPRQARTPHSLPSSAHPHACLLSWLLACVRACVPAAATRRNTKCSQQSRFATLKKRKKRKEHTKLLLHIPYPAFSFVRNFAKMRKIKLKLEYSSRNCLVFF